MADCDIFDIDGADPLAARLDDVLGAIGDLHRPVLVDIGDVAGVEKAVLIEHIAAIAFEIAAAIAGRARPGGLSVSTVPGHGHCFRHRQFSAQRRTAGGLA